MHHDGYHYEYNYYDVEEDYYDRRQRLTEMALGCLAMAFGRGVFAAYSGKSGRQSTVMCHVCLPEAFRHFNDPLWREVEKFEVVNLANHSRCEFCGLTPYDRGVVDMLLENPDKYWDASKKDPSCSWCNYMSDAFNAFNRSMTR